MSDDLKLISREEIQLRFGLQPAFMKMWMEAKEADRCPFIRVGKTTPMFYAPAFFAWLRKRFGQGDWSGLEAGEKSGPEEPEKRPGRPRLFNLGVS